MGTRTQHTKTDLSRCVARLLLAAQHARLAVGSRRGGPPLVRVRFGGNSPPLPTNWSVLFSSSEFFCSRVSVFESFFCCCGVKQRSVLGTVAPRVCCLQLVPQRRRPAALRARCRAAVPAFAESGKAAEITEIDFFFVDFERIRFSAGLSRDASLGGARFFVFFFFFFVLLSEDNHRRSPHVAVGVTRRLTLRKCLACMPIC